MSRLSASVGLGVRSNGPDVKYIQTLLSDWLLVGGQVPLTVDGLCGPLTDRAIKQFQIAETGIADGRIDPEGPAIKKLEIKHVENPLSGIYGLAQLAAISGIPPSWQLNESDLWSRYLVTLRNAFE